MVVGKPLFTKEQIQVRVQELAEKISSDYVDKDLLAVGILKGGFIFFADIVRAIKVPLTVDFILASSYLKNSTTGEVKVHYDIKEDVSDKDVLYIEDIVDTGITLNHIRERVLARSPRSLKICAFLDKRKPWRCRTQTRRAALFCPTALPTQPDSSRPHLSTSPR